MKTRCYQSENGTERDHVEAVQLRSSSDLDQGNGRQYTKKRENVNMQTAFWKFHKGRKIQRRKSQFSPSFWPSRVISVNILALLSKYNRCITFDIWYVVISFRQCTQYTLNFLNYSKFHHPEVTIYNNRLISFKASSYTCIYTGVNQWMHE